MAYEDRTVVRTRIYTVRANDYESDVVEAYARYVRKSPAAVWRELAMEEVRRRLHELEACHAAQEMEAAQQHQAA